MSGNAGMLGWACGKAAWILGLGGVVMLLSGPALDWARGASGDGARSRPTTTADAGEGSDSSRTIALTADRAGHFWVDGKINDTPVRFIVDTGATGIALGRDLAEDAGIRIRDRDYTLSSRTANGISRAAPITVRRLRVGSITLYNVDAHVMEKPMPGMALLGMSFLGRLEGYEVRGDRMVLHW